MVEDLDGLVEVDVPNGDHAVGAHREQVGRRGIFRGPVHLENVTVMEIVPLFEGLGTQEWCLAARVHVLNRLDLPDSEDVVLTACGHVFAVFPELDDPDGALVILQFDRLL